MISRGASIHSLRSETKGGLDFAKELRGETDSLLARMEETSISYDGGNKSVDYDSSDEYSEDEEEEEIAMDIATEEMERGLSLNSRSGDTSIDPATVNRLYAQLPPTTLLSHGIEEKNVTYWDKAKTVEKVLGGVYVKDEEEDEMNPHVEEDLEEDDEEDEEAAKNRVNWLSKLEQDHEAL